MSTHVPGLQSVFHFFFCIIVYGPNKTLAAKGLKFWNTVLYGNFLNNTVSRIFLKQYFLLLEGPDCSAQGVQAKFIVLLSVCRMSNSLFFSLFAGCQIHCSSLCLQDVWGGHHWLHSRRDPAQGVQANPHGSLRPRPGGHAPLYLQRCRARRRPQAHMEPLRTQYPKP